MISLRQVRGESFSLQVRFSNVYDDIPGVEPFGYKDLVILGQSQSRQPIFQVAHVGGLDSCRVSGGVV